MSISEMRQYMDLCLQGEKTISERKRILEIKWKELMKQMKLSRESIDYIDWKQQYYDEVLSGKTAYTSNLIFPEDGKQENGITE